MALPKPLGIDEKSGQLIECVNPAHLYFGSIHYIQPDCVGKRQLSGEIGTIGTVQIDAVSIVKYWAPDNDPLRFESDESWQASEALLKPVIMPKSVCTHPKNRVIEGDGHTL